MRIFPLLLLTCAASCGDADEPRRPNVLLISVDTLRPDHLGCYDYGRNTSPHIDALARDGVLFENCISSTSWTLPAHAALFTSVADSVHGCTEATGTALAPGFTTIAERFQAAGYATAGFFAGPYLHPAFGLGQGFDAYVNCMPYAQSVEGRPVDDWAMAEDVMRASHQGVTNPTVYAESSKWIAEQQDGPFFAFVHFWDVHFDFVPPTPYDTMFDPDYEGRITGEDFFFDERINASLPARDIEHLVALYDGEIRWTDEHIGKLTGDLEARGLLDETIVVVSADHGTEFFEHGGKAHRTTLFDEQIRIPLVIRYPASLPRGARVAEQARIIDIGPTLLELANVAAPTDVMGESLAGLARGETLDFDNTAVSELFSVGRAMRSSRTLENKFVDDLGHGTYYWFDLEGDPAELAPRQDIEAGAGKAASERYLRDVESMEAWLARRPGDPVEPELPPGVEGSLTGHGYTGGDIEDD